MTISINGSTGITFPDNSILSPSYQNTGGNHVYSFTGTGSIKW